MDLFLQQVEDNEWQAENRNLSESGLPLTAENKIPVTYVDWGDNLEVKDWSTKQKIRVETRLLQDVSTLADTDVAGPDTAGTGMTGYLMGKYGEVTGPDEMWGVVAEEGRQHLAGHREPGNGGLRVHRRGVPDDRAGRRG